MSLWGNGQNRQKKPQNPDTYPSVAVARGHTFWEYVWGRVGHALDLDRAGLRELRARVGMTRRDAERAAEILAAIDVFSIELGPNAPRLRALRAPEGEA
jgi:hypothetical protein